VPPAIFTYPADALVISTPGGLVFADDGSGITFGEGLALTFPVVAPDDLGSLFPSYIPNAETLIYDALAAATSPHTYFPVDGTGISLPAAFSLPPDLADRLPAYLAGPTVAPTAAQPSDAADSPAVAGLDEYRYRDSNPPADP
jgi:hypothetical protein